MVKRTRNTDGPSSGASGKKRARNKNSSTAPTMRLSAEKKSKIAQFLSISGGGGQISEAAAKLYLDDSGWSIEVALNNFFSDGGAKARSMGAAGSAVRVNVSSIETAFNKYATDGNGIMDSEQLFKFCEDLEINPAEDAVILVILHLMDVESMEAIPLQKWIDGFRAMGVDSVDALKKKLKMNSNFKISKNCNMVLKFQLSNSYL